MRQKYFYHLRLNHSTINIDSKKALIYFLVAIWLLSITVQCLDFLLETTTQQKTFSIPHWARRASSSRNRASSLPIRHPGQSLVSKEKRFMSGNEVGRQQICTKRLSFLDNWCVLNSSRPSTLTLVNDTCMAVRWIRMKSVLPAHSDTGSRYVSVRNLGWGGLVSSNQISGATWPGISSSHGHVRRIPTIVYLNLHKVQNTFRRTPDYSYAVG